MRHPLRYSGKNSGTCVELRAWAIKIITVTPPSVGHLTIKRWLPSSITHAVPNLSIHTHSARHSRVRGQFHASGGLTFQGFGIDVNHISCILYTATTNLKPKLTVIVRSTLLPKCFLWLLSLSWTTVFIRMLLDLLIHLEIWSKVRKCQRKISSGKIVNNY